MTKNTDSELLNFPSFPPGSSASLESGREVLDPAALIGRGDVLEGDLDRVHPGTTCEEFVTQIRLYAGNGAFVHRLSAAAKLS